MFFELKVKEIKIFSYKSFNNFEKIGNYTSLLFNLNNIFLLMYFSMTIFDKQNIKA